VDYLKPIKHSRNFDIYKENYYNLEKDKKHLPSLYNHLQTRAIFNNTAFYIHLTTNRKAYKLTAYYRSEETKSRNFLKVLLQQNPKFKPILKKERLLSKSGNYYIGEVVYIKLFNVVHSDLTQLIDFSSAILPRIPRNMSDPDRSPAFQSFVRTLGSHIIDHPVYSASALNIRTMDVTATKDARPVLNALIDLTKDLSPRPKAVAEKYYHPMITQTLNLDIEDDLELLGMDRISHDNPNIYQVADILEQRYDRFAPQEELSDAFFQTVLEEMSDAVPCDQYGWPIVISPPPPTLERLVDAGPKSTSGGTNQKGEKHSKTNLYFENITEAYNIITLCEENVENFKQQESSLEPIRFVKNVPMMPLIMSPKTEIIKKGKKNRFFMIIQGVWSLLESAYFGPILDMVKACPMSKTGGRRIMNGATLDRGVGIDLLSKMISRNGQDTKILQQLVTDFDEKEETTKICLSKSKSIVTDFSAFEFQHNLQVRMASIIEYLVKYTFNTEADRTVALVMAIKTELTTKSDIDIGCGKMLQLAPGDEGSGNILTLDNNGKSNKLYQRMAGYDLARSVDIKQCDFDFLNLSNYVNNGLYQGDDGYFATFDDKDINAGIAVINLLKEKYQCQIKDDVKNLFAKLDNQGFDKNDAGDFLKTKPTITKKGIYFIRDTENSMMRLILPNATEYNASTQLYAAISQMYNSYGNQFVYNIAKTKLNLLAELCRQKNVCLSSDSKQTVLDDFLRKMDVKGQSVIEFFTVDGFRDLSFTSINELFLFPNQGLIKNLNQNSQCYSRYGLSYDALQQYVGANSDF